MHYGGNGQRLRMEELIDGSADRLRSGEGLRIDRHEIEDVAGGTLCQELLRCRRVRALDPFVTLREEQPSRQCHVHYRVLVD